MRLSVRSFRFDSSFEIWTHLVDLVDVGLLMELLHGTGSGLERGERLRGRLAALQGDDLLLELELLVLELLNLLLVELLLLEALQRGALVLGAVEILRLLELGRHLLMQQHLALLEHGQRLRYGRDGEGQRSRARFAGRFWSSYFWGRSERGHARPSASRPRPGGWSSAHRSPRRRWQGPRRPRPLNPCFRTVS